MNNSKRKMKVMATPNPHAYVFRDKQGKEAIEEAKYIVIGTEDGWLECKGSKGWEKYLEAKFICKYCNNCGSQRCEGIHSEWFEGCKYKDFLNFKR